MRLLEGGVYFQIRILRCDAAFVRGNTVYTWIWIQIMKISHNERAHEKFRKYFIRANFCKISTRVLFSKNWQDWLASVYFLQRLDICIFFLTSYHVVAKEIIAVTTVLKSLKTSFTIKLFYTLHKKWEDFSTNISKLNQIKKQNAKKELQLCIPEQLY